MTAKRKRMTVTLRDLELLLIVLQPDQIIKRKSTTRVELSSDTLVILSTGPGIGIIVLVKCSFFKI